MKQRIKLEGNKSIFKGVSDKYKQLLQDEIVATNEDVANKARSRVPVDTGFLKNSIITQQTEKGAETIVSVKYAPYIEFGTGGKVDVPEGLESYAKQFKGKGVKQVNIPPRPYLYNSWREETAKMLQRLRNAIK